MIRIMVTVLDALALFGTHEHTASIPVRSKQLQDMSVRVY